MRLCHTRGSSVQWLRDWGGRQGFRWLDSRLLWRTRTRKEKSFRLLKPWQLIAVVQCPRRSGSSQNCEVKGSQTASKSVKLVCRWYNRMPSEAATACHCRVGSRWLESEFLYFTYCRLSRACYSTNTDFLLGEFSHNQWHLTCSDPTSWPSGFVWCSSLSWPT